MEQEVSVERIEKTLASQEEILALLETITVGDAAEREARISRCKAIIAHLQALIEERKLSPRLVLD